MSELCRGAGRGEWLKTSLGSSQIHADEGLGNSRPGLTFLNMTLNYNEEEFL